MARQMVETLVDDVDGSEAAETVSFALDGSSYEIDLSKRNATAMRRLLGRYIDAARSADRRGSARSSSRSASRSSARGKNGSGRNYEIAQLREWAGANKVKVPARGRIPQAVVEQFLSRKN